MVGLLKFASDTVAHFVQSLPEIEIDSGSIDAFFADRVQSHVLSETIKRKRISVLK
jgi:hypothetical protein